MPTVQANLRLTFSNVLLPTDFTSVSTQAFAYARTFAKAYGARILVTHAVPPNPPVFIPMEPVPLQFDAEWKDAQEQMERIQSSPFLEGTLHEGVLERGELWNVLQDVMQRHAVDLIVLASHGKHGLKKLVLGSAAEQIFRKADCPVLTIGPQVPLPRDEAATFKRIVFATDFSAGSLAALPYALSLAEENQAHLTLLHVRPMVPVQHQPWAQDHAKQKLEALVPPGASDWCEPTTLVSFEFPAEGILHTASAENADLIVMGVHKGAPVASAHLPWAIAYEVVCHAKCPVLTVRG
ncbi:MAG TPA: universal stress protein [Terriglobales bacterium]|nr:universal stress protein [Terriglobales bacterium]